MTCANITAAKAETFRCRVLFIALPTPFFTTQIGTDDRRDRIRRQLLLVVGYAAEEKNGMDLSSKTDDEAEELVERRKVTANAF